MKVPRLGYLGGGLRAKCLVWRGIAGETIRGSRMEGTEGE